MVEQAGNTLGRQLGNYTLTRVLGKGGFAEVYLGIHKHLETQAAIKVLLTQLNQADQENFLAEARIVARLRHPHIVHILEFGIEEGIPYLVMNYAAHGTLRSHFQRGIPLHMEAFLPYLKQIASALQYAHDRNLIHRDIKPENMLLDEQNEVFLSDFGIATQARSSHSQTIEEIIGTVVYMSPEQLRGKPRAASDQYSLAILTYEWLCGVRPFMGSNYLAIATQHVNTPPTPPREHVPTLQSAVEQVLLTALAKDYHQRYTCIQDFVAALELAHLTGRYFRPQEVPPQSAPAQPIPQPSLDRPHQELEPPMALTLLPAKPLLTVTSPAKPWPMGIPDASAPPSKPGFSRRALIGGGVTAALLAGSGISWWAATHLVTSPMSGNAPNPTPLKGIYLQQARLIHTYRYPTDVYSVAWSSDSKSVASIEKSTILHVWNAASGADLWSETFSDEVTRLEWSPNGAKLAVLTISTTARSIRVYDAATHAFSATTSTMGVCMAWSPDSKVLALGTPDANTEIASWDGISSHPKTPILQGYDTVLELAWHPNGQYIANGVTSGDQEFSEVYVWKIGNNLASSPSMFPVSTLGPVAAVSWSPDTRHYIASGSTQNIEIWDFATLGKTYYRKYQQFVSPVAWSPSGRYLASATPTDHTIHVWDSITADIASSCQGHTDTITALVWSPDGNYLASTSQDRSVRIWQVRQ
jgi:serine/threonine protein kinase